MTTTAVANVAPNQDQRISQQTQARPVREVRPAVDVYENADELLMRADMPGASADSVKIRVENSLLTLQAQRTANDSSEASLQYYRAFQVPDSVDPEGISAQLKQGVLHVQLKKHERAKPRVIQIRST
ncbi:MAG TPA: Hsp20/alpha crystallin family protein [Polyangiales bacterium]|nr:Hsp20/alpha crystallin family protein [Polyangiales bacterium]